jgi:DNA polymerase II large subunit
MADDADTDGDADADELEAAVEAFLEESETVLSEYDQGYMDADAALTRLVDGIEELEEVHEG